VSTPVFFDQEPIVGWRAWAVAETDGGPELRSVAYQHPWKVRRPLRIVCEPGGCPAARWPDQPHSCGIHAFKSRADAAAFPSTWESRRVEANLLPQRYVLGQVSLWGRVFEHQYGYRGALAYPYALLLSPADEQLVRRLAARYGVDVLS